MMPGWESWGVELWAWLAALVLSGVLAVVGAAGLLAPSCVSRGKLLASATGWRASLLFCILLFGGIGGVGWQVWQGSELKPLAAPFDLEAADDEFHRRHFPEGAIRTGPADSSYNCHGWTFADGLYSLSDAEVWERLQSAAWQLVSHPAPGDVIVYQGIGGGIRHTGIVRSLDERGQVWVESKWGQLGRYLHQARVANSSAELIYYRPVAATMAE